MSGYAIRTRELLESKKQTIAILERENTLLRVMIADLNRIIETKLNKKWNKQTKQKKPNHSFATALIVRKNITQQQDIKSSALNALI